MNRESAASPSFVILQIGNRRFALASENVVELAPPVRLHRFPHTSPLLAGVIVRRGRIVPVFDASSLVVGSVQSTQRFYLIAHRHANQSGSLGAIAVSGECQLASGEVLPPEADCPPWVTGILRCKDDSIEILDFSRLASSRAVESAPDGVEASL